MKGVFGLDDLHGRILRSVILKTASLDEAFLVDFALELAPERLLPSHGAGATLVNVLPFVDMPGAGVSLLYRKPIISTSPRDEIIGIFDAQKVPDAVADAAVADYSKVKPVAEEVFWSLLEPVRGRVNTESVDEVVTRIAKFSTTRILGFARHYFELLAKLSTPEILAQSSELVEYPGDAFLWWRLAVIAGGEELTNRVLSRAHGVMIDDENWSAAEELVDICERAWELRTGVRPIFSNGVLPTPGPEIGTERPDYLGVRSTQAMIDDNRFPQIVGSRFLVENGDQLSDCVAIQLIDVYSEVRESVLQILADEVANREGGRVASRVFGRNTYTGSLYDGLAVFRSKRSIGKDSRIIFDHE